MNRVGISRGRWRKSFWREEKVALALTAWEVVPPVKIVWMAVPVQTALPDLAHV